MRLKYTDSSCELARACRIIRILEKQYQAPGEEASIKKACLNQQAFLFVDSNTFAVLKPVIEAEKNGVLIWAAHSDSLHPIEEYQSDIEALSKAIKAEFLFFITRRPGFRRLAKRLGYTLQSNSNGIQRWRKPL